MTTIQKSEKHQKWKALVEDCRASKLSKRQWCREHKIPDSTFRYWEVKFSTKEQALGKSFVELPEREESGIVLEVQGVKIRLDKGFDESLLLSCLRVLRRSSC